MTRARSPVIPKITSTSAGRGPPFACRFTARAFQLPHGLHKPNALDTPPGITVGRRLPGEPPSGVHQTFTTSTWQMLAKAIGWSAHSYLATRGRCMVHPVGIGSLRCERAPAVRAGRIESKAGTMGSVGRRGRVPTHRGPAQKKGKPTSYSSIGTTTTPSSHCCTSWRPDCSRRRP